MLLNSVQFRLSYSKGQTSACTEILSWYESSFLDSATFISRAETVRKYVEARAYIHVLRHGTSSHAMDRDSFSTCVPRNLGSNGWIVTRTINSSESMNAMGKIGHLQEKIDTYLYKLFQRYCWVALPPTSVCRTYASFMYKAIYFRPEDSTSQLANTMCLV